MNVWKINTHLRILKTHISYNLLCNEVCKNETEEVLQGIVDNNYLGHSFNQPVMIQ